VPNELYYTPLNGIEQRITRAGAGANDAANAVTRIPAGHPEGYLEAFATLYQEIAQALQTEQSADLVPGLTDAVWGMRFIDACLKSSAADAAWTEI
jgi:predicted dehydrogenase